MVVPPNHPFLIGLSIINHPFWGTPIFGNTHIVQMFGKNIHDIMMVLLMATRNPVNSPVERFAVFFPIIYKGLYIPGVVWDF